MTAKNCKTKAIALPGLDDVSVAHPLDFYRTPVSATIAVLRAPLSSTSQVRPLSAPFTWIDCGAGDGAISEVVAQRWPESCGFAVELDPGRAKMARFRLAQLGLQSRVTVIEGDFLRETLPSVDLVIGNPPYTEGGGALLFAKRSLQLGREVALLLRVGFLEGEEEEDRDAFLEQHPHDLAVLPWRPAFKGNGGTDSATYAWVLFGPGRGGRYVRLRRRDPAQRPADGQRELFQ